MADNEPRGFIEILADMPATEAKMTSAIAELLAAIDETGKGGFVALTIKVTPGKNDDAVLTFDPAVKVNKPVMPLRSNTFFKDGAGNPVTSHPTARTLFGDEDIEIVRPTVNEPARRTAAEEAPKRVSE